MKYQSLIITSSNIERKEIEILLNESLKIGAELNTMSTMEIVPEKNSIGISDLENIIEWISRKSSHTKTVIIRRAEKLTPEAQNSLLKTLEEPPENTLILLLTSNERVLLETIRSRCQLIQLRDDSVNRTNFKQLSQEFLSTTYLNKLKIVEKLIKDYDNREEIGNFILEVIRAIPKTRENIDKFDSLKKIYIGANKNVNLKLSLDLLCLITT